jgi:hypothetical protein
MDSFTITYEDGIAQPAKVAPFDGGNKADVRKSAAGDFFQFMSGRGL